MMKPLTPADIDALGSLLPKTAQEIIAIALEYQQRRKESAHG